MAKFVCVYEAAKIENFDETPANDLVKKHVAHFKNTKQKFFCLLLAGFFLAISCQSQKTPQSENSSPAEAGEENYGVPEELNFLSPGAELPVSQFREIWTYLVAGREQALKLNQSISDLVYFGAEVDSYGKLVDIPDFKKIAQFKGRKHFVATCNSRSLTHFVLIEGSAERKALIRDLLEAAEPYDGLQIDFEYVPARDGEAFLSFLWELRAGLGKKIFSAALPARTRALADDVYDYAKIKPIVDRIFVMAYDEHWSNSKPGPIASMGWCQRVAKHSLDIVGTEKLIMGLPFYGRSWGSINANKAYIYSTIEEIIKEQKIKEIERENGIPFFEYESHLSITVYFEDNYSLSARLEMYKKLGVMATGFWRLGQESQSFWSIMELASQTP